MTLRSHLVALGTLTAITALPLVATAEEADGMNGGSTFGFNGITGALGVVFPEGGLDTTFGLEAHIDMGAPLASTPQLLFMPGLSFWTGGEGDADWSEFGILADAVYTLPVGEPEDGWMVFFGGGLGIYFTSFDFEFVEPFTGTRFSESQSDTDFGISLLGGGAKPVSENLDIFAQLRLKFDGVDTTNIHGGVKYRFAK
jgi:hypothetical protein